MNRSCAAARPHASGWIGQPCRVAVAALLVFYLLPLPAFAQSWRPARLWVAGDEKSIWIVGASAASKPDFPVVQMWHSGPNEPAASPKQLPSVTGEILALGADAEALRVLYSDLSVRDYLGDRSSLGGARWRDLTEARPLAWAGDSTEAIFWALIDAAVLKPPTTQKTTQPADQAAASESADLDDDGQAGPTGRLMLLELCDDRWNRIAAPPEAADGEAFWIAGRKGLVWLFWQAPGRGILASSHRTKPATPKPTSKPKIASSRRTPAWTTPELVTADADVRCGWAGAAAQGLVFVAGRGASADRVQLHLYMREHKSWSDKGPARYGTELLEIDSRLDGVGVARGQLAIARPAQKGQVEIGLGDLGVSPSIRFFTLPWQPAGGQEVSSWQQTLILGVVLALVTLALWTRREQVVRPLVLPPELALAPVWRRLLATIIDAIPAMIVILPFVMLLMPKDLQAFDWSSLEQLQANPEMQALALPVNAAFVFCYALWCLLWELGLGSTPGKLLLGCRVATTGLARPTSKQILWRNALRVVEVGLGSPGWIVTLMMLVLVTRNRQRVGDVLADTIVVMRAPLSTDQQPRP